MTSEGYLLVNRKGLVGGALVADGTQPLRTLLLQLQVRRGIEALYVCAEVGPTRHLHPHKREGTLEGENLGCRDDVRVGKLLRDWGNVSAVMGCGYQTDQYVLSWMTEDLGIFFPTWILSASC